MQTGSSSSSSTSISAATAPAPTQAPASSISLSAAPAETNAPDILDNFLIGLTPSTAQAKFSALTPEQCAAMAKNPTQIILGRPVLQWVVIYAPERVVDILSYYKADLDAAADDVPAKELFSISSAQHIEGNLTHSTIDLLLLHENMTGDLLKQIISLLKDIFRISAHGKSFINEFSPTFQLALHHDSMRFCQLISMLSSEDIEKLSLTEAFSIFEQGLTPDSSERSCAHENSALAVFESLNDDPNGLALLEKMCAEMPLMFLNMWAPHQLDNYLSTKKEEIISGQLKIYTNHVIIIGLNIFQKRPNEYFHPYMDSFKQLLVSLHGRKWVTQPMLMQMLKDLSEHNQYIAQHLNMVDWFFRQGDKVFQKTLCSMLQNDLSVAIPLLVFITQDPALINMFFSKEMDVVSSFIIKAIIVTDRQDAVRLLYYILSAYQKANEKEFEQYVTDETRESIAAIYEVLNVELLPFSAREAVGTEDWKWLKFIYRLINIGKKNILGENIYSQILSKATSIKGTREQLIFIIEYYFNTLQNEKNIKKTSGAADILLAISCVDNLLNKKKLLEMFFPYTIFSYGRETAILSRLQEKAMIFLSTARNEVKSSTNCITSTHDLMTRSSYSDALKATISNHAATLTETSSTATASISSASHTTAATPSATSSAAVSLGSIASIHALAFSPQKTVKRCMEFLNVDANNANLDVVETKSTLLYLMCFFTRQLHAILSDDMKNGQLITKGAVLAIKTLFEQVAKADGTTKFEAIYHVLSLFFPSLGLQWAPTVSYVYVKLGLHNGLIDYWKRQLKATREPFPFHEEGIDEQLLEVIAINLLTENGDIILLSTDPRMKQALLSLLKQIQATLSNPEPNEQPDQKMRWAKRIVNTLFDRLYITPKHELHTNEHLIRTNASGIIARWFYMMHNPEAMDTHQIAFETFNTIRFIPSALPYIIETITTANILQPKATSYLHMLLQRKFKNCSTCLSTIVDWVKEDKVSADLLWQSVMELGLGTVTRPVTDFYYHLMKQDPAREKMFIEKCIKELTIQQVIKFIVGADNQHRIATGLISGFTPYQGKCLNNGEFVCDLITWIKFYLPGLLSQDPSSSAAALTQQCLFASAQEIAETARLCEALEFTEIDAAPEESTSPDVVVAVPTPATSVQFFKAEDSLNLKAVQAWLDDKVVDEEQEQRLFKL